MNQNAASVPDECAGFLCVYSQNFFRGEIVARFPATEEVPRGFGVSAAISVFNGTDKKAVVYKEENFSGPYEEIPPGAGLGHPGMFLLSVRFTDPDPA